MTAEALRAALRKRASELEDEVNRAADAAREADRVLTRLQGELEDHRTVLAVIALHLESGDARRPDPRNDRV